MYQFGPAIILRRSNTIGRIHGIVLQSNLLFFLWHFVYTHLVTEHLNTYILIYMHFTVVALCSA